MKYLNNFIQFDFKAFSKGKQFRFKGVSVWKDYKTKEVLGSNVSVGIVDDSIYITKDGEEVCGANDMETISIKVRQPIEVFEKWNRRDEIEVVNIEKASVYGDYSDKLSVIADVVNKTNEEANYYYQI